MQIEVSKGEIIDKFTIASIKLEKIHEEEKRNNVRYEYEILEKAVLEIKSHTKEDLSFVIKELKLLNEQIWDTVDKICKKEVSKEFDGEFIELARNTYLLNDLRSKVKRKINLMTNSCIIEEKLYLL